MDNLGGDVDAIQVSATGRRAGAEREFDDFVEACSTRLLRTAYLLTHDRGRAEDLLQTALVKAWLSWSRIDSDPAAYVNKILVSTYATWWRRTWNGERPTPEPTHDLWAALGRLPRRQRAVIVLRYVEDLSEAETARLLGRRREEPAGEGAGRGGPWGGDPMSIEQLEETLRAHAAALQDDAVAGRGPAVRRRAATIRLRRALVAAVVTVIVVPVAVMTSLGAKPFDRTAPVVTPPRSNGPFVGTYAGRTLIDSEIVTGKSELSFTAEVSRNTEWRAICRGVGSGYTLHMALDGGETGRLPCDVELLSGRWISYRLGPEYPQEGEHTLRLWLTSASGREKAPPADGQLGAAVYRLPEPVATVAGHQVQALEMDGGSEFRLVRREESMPGTRVLSSTYSSRALPVEVGWYTSGSGSQEVQVYVDGRPETVLVLGDGGPGLVLAPGKAHTVSLRIMGDVPRDALLGLVWREEVR